MNNLPMASESEANVTVELVERVSERMGTGVPLELALAGEPVSLEDYEEHLRTHPEAAGLAGAARRKFVQRLIGLLLNADDPSANCRWLLERLYPEVFTSQRQGKDDEVEVEVRQERQTIAGVPEEYVNRLRAERHRHDMEYYERQAREREEARGNC